MSEPADRAGTRPEPGPRRTAGGAVDGRTTRGTRDTGLRDVVREQILDAILTGELQPGELLQTSAVAERHGVSRTPAREALAALERDGLVTVIPYRGYVVRAITLEEVRDVFFMRTVLEGAAAERAASRFGEAELEALVASHAAGCSLGEAYTREHDRHFNGFHRAIAAAADSPRLAAALDTVLNDVRRVQSLSLHPPSPAAIDAEHEEIVAALRARDPARAKAAMDRHIRSLYRRAVDLPPG